MQLVFTLVIIIMIWLLSIDILIWDVKYYGRFLPKFGISENGTVCSLFPRFPCVLVRSPNQKRFFSVFKVSLNIMRQSDSASADVEIQKPPKELHLTGAPDCLAEKSSVRSFFLRSIVHSSLMILILLFDRILGLPFALKAEMSSEHVVDSNLSTGDRGCRWLAVRLVAHLTTSLHLSPMSAFAFKHNLKIVFDIL